MEPFVEQLKRLCREHPTRAKWVFVPSHAIGHTLGDRLVLEGTDWANLRFVTPFDIALQMGAPFLVERGIDPSEEGLGPALIMRLLLGLPESSTYFRPLAQQPEMARALWSTIRELRMAGLGALRITCDAFESAAKHTELQALVDAYEVFLKDNKCGDRATVFAEAVQHPDWCPIQAQDCWTELPNVIWSPLERRLIEAMPGERIAPEALEIPGATLPRRLEGASVVPVAPDASAPLAFLLAPADRRTLGPLDPRTSMFTSGGTEAEVEEVFRRIVASGLPFDAAEIVCAQSASETLIWEKCLRYDWPVTLADGVPASITRPGRALLAFTDWIEDDFAAGRLRKLLQSGDVTLPAGKGADNQWALSPSRAARLLVKAQAAWGRETYGLALGRLARSDRTRADRDDVSDEESDRLRREADQADELAVWINGIIGGIPRTEVSRLGEGWAAGPTGWVADPRGGAAEAWATDPTPGASEPRHPENIPLQRLVTCAEHFVTTHTARTSALDHAAADAIASALCELKALGDFRCDLRQALRFLTERAESVRIGADRPRPGHLHVSTLRGAAWSNRRLLFIIGLEEGRVFPAAFEDPILLDSERARISPSLVLSGDRIDESVFAAVSRMAAASARPDVAVCLSYSCRDLREFRETYASWLMLQAYRVISGNPAASYTHMHEAVGAAKSCVPESPAAALGESRWWLNGLVRAGLSGRPAVLDHYTSLAAGLKAEEARESAVFTEFDGYVPAAGLVLDPASPDRVVSPTQLEDAAECGFRYFLHRGLHVDAIESGDRDRDVWLNPLLRGSLLHDLYAGLLRRSRDAQRLVSLPADRDWLIDQGRKTLSDLRREMPPPSPEIDERETDAFLDDLALFAEAESRANTSTAIGLEVAFGRGDPTDNDGEALAQVEPVTVNLGGGLSFRIAGRIDRIDRVNSSSGPKGSADFEIIDYKTGSYYEPAWKGTFAGGTRLQHALYGLAALELLKRDYKGARIARATYYFTSAKGRQSHKRIDAQPIAKVTEVLADLRGVIAKGLFVHAVDEEACKFCDYGHACSEKAQAQAEVKHADPALAPVLKLAAHE